MPSPRAVRQPRHLLSPAGVQSREHMVNAGRGYKLGRQTDDVSHERRHGFMSKGAAGDGRSRSHSNGHSGGAHRLFPHSPVEKERPVGHRAADHDLPALPHIHACASQTHISGGRGVGRMDVPHRRLQGWQVRARTGCSLSVRALCVFGSGALPMTICEGQRRGLVAPVALSYPLRCKTPCLMTSCLRPTDNN